MPPDPDVLCSLTGVQSAPGTVFYVAVPPILSARPIHGRAWNWPLDQDGLRLRRPDNVNNVLDGNIVMVRARVVTLAKMHAELLLRNISDRVI